MSDSPRVNLLPVFGLLLAVLISPRLAHAQSADGDRWTVIDVTTAMKRAIEESKNGVELREKIVRRFAECSLTYGALSRMASNADARKNYYQAQIATMEIESTVAQPMESKRKLEIEDAAQKSAAMTIDLLKSRNDSELASLLKSCKSINDVKELNEALRELSRE